VTGADDTAEAVEVTITYLELTHRPHHVPPLPSGPHVALVAAEAPPAHYFLYLYDTVGAEHDWTDWHARPRRELEAFVADPKVEIFTMMLDGWPGGFFVLDTREAGVCDLAYFGLMPEAHGRGLGGWLLGEAVLSGWERPGVEKLTVNTCTLDHPRALPLYQKLGFDPVGQETVRRVPGRPGG
jgi:GNAT superfamily N-acetyltransferase